MVEPEHKKIEAYIRGLSENIKGDVTSSKLANINEAVRVAHALMEQRVQARAKRIAEGNKMKWENSQKRGHTRNRCLKKNNQKAREASARAYVMKEGDQDQGIKCGDGTLIDINLVRLNTSYEVEFANGKIVIIKMDWLSKRDVVIVCGKNFVRVPYKNKTLIVKGDRGKSRLKVISCIKAQKYIERGCMETDISQKDEKQSQKRQN
ncbi:hypothetical protein Tco_0474296 [Tanacetum coccineum]